MKVHPVLMLEITLRQNEFCFRREARSAQLALYAKAVIVAFLAELRQYYDILVRYFHLFLFFISIILIHQ